MRATVGDYVLDRLSTWFEEPVSSDDLEGLADTRFTGDPSS